jgi:cytochrome c2
VLEPAPDCQFRSQECAGQEKEIVVMNRVVLAAAMAVLGLGNPAFAGEAEVAAGEKVFKKCKACHAVGEGAKNKVGPQLNDLFGRVPGTVEGYKYSKAMKAFGEDGKVWDAELLTNYLAGPKKLVKGTKMSMAGLKKPDDIANVIEYLKTFDPDEAGAS